MTARRKKAKSGTLAAPATKPISDNPKNVAANNRIKTSWMPAAGKIHGAMACMLGAFKYDPYNWREKPVAVMEYVSAMERHLMKFTDGEDYEDMVHHLGNVIAGAAIVLDAIENGNAIDDRPRKGTANILLKRMQDMVPAIREIAAKGRKPIDRRDRPSLKSDT